MATEVMRLSDVVELKPERVLHIIALLLIEAVEQSSALAYLHNTYWPDLARYVCDLITGRYSVSGRTACLLRRWANIADLANAVVAIIVRDLMRETYTAGRLPKEGAA